MKPGLWFVLLVFLGSCAQELTKIHQACGCKAGQICLTEAPDSSFPEAFADPRSATCLDVPSACESAFSSDLRVPASCQEAFCGELPFSTFRFRRRHFVKCG